MKPHNRSSSRSSSVRPSRNDEISDSETGRGLDSGSGAALGPARLGLALGGERQTGGKEQEGCRGESEARGGAVGTDGGAAGEAEPSRFACYCPGFIRGTRPVFNHDAVRIIVDETCLPAFASEVLTAHGSSYPNAI